MPDATQKLPDWVRTPVMSLAPERIAPGSPMKTFADLGTTDCMIRCTPGRKQKVAP